MRDVLRYSVAIFLLAELAAIRWAAGEEFHPVRPELGASSRHYGDWSAVREDPVDSDVLDQLRADRVLSRTYVQSSTSLIANLFVAWFQSQRSGLSQPHSPQVCLPASGWTPLETGRLEVNTSDGPIRVNRYLVTRGENRAIVLYWYQSPHRTAASEWDAKLFTVADSLIQRRSDITLVRVVVWSVPGSEEASTSTAASFVATVYPLLKQQLPR